MSKGKGLREVDCEYANHMQMYEEIEACNKGAKSVLALVQDRPAIVYADSNYGQMCFDHLGDDGALRARNHVHNKNLANYQRRQEYWSRGRFFNATSKTVKSFDGMIHSKKAELDFSPKMTIIAENVTGSGQSIGEFEKVVTKELIKLGRFGALSDMAPTNRQLTSAEQESPEFQPRAIKYLAKDILRSVVKNGSLIDLRLNEVHTVKCGDYDYEDKCFTRRLYMSEGKYYNELYNDKEELIDISEPRWQGQSFTEIPFVFYGSDANTPDYSVPPMFDIAHINMGHFSLDCDNRDNLYYHGQGMTNVFTDMEGHEFDAMNPAGLDTGAKGKNMFKSTDKVELLQIEATGAIPAEMLRDQDRMIQAGAQLIQPNGGTMTFGQKKLETGSSLSTLAQIAENTTAGIEQQLKYLAMFAGDSYDNKYKVNSKFITDEMTPEKLNVHLAMVQGGVLPAVTLNCSARAANLTQLDDEQIAEKLLEEGESLTGIGEREAALQAEIDALKEQLANQE